LEDVPAKGKNLNSVGDEVSSIPKNLKLSGKKIGNFKTGWVGFLIGLGDNLKIYASDSG